ncbi:MAG: exopolyphosphatase [Marmoricola sp.]
MTRVAAVDCGTNSVRLLVADVGPEGKVDVHREMRIVRLGQDVDRAGVLAPEAIERTRVALVEFAASCDRLQVEATRMVATSATRDAGNRDEFTAMVQEALGVAPEVIDGPLEAELSFLGATARLDSSNGPFLVMDIGGGSTEVVLGTSSVQASRSVDIGCVRLTERYLHSDPPTVAEIAAARAAVVDAVELVRAVVSVEQARTAVGLAGSVTTVAALALGLPSYDSKAIHLSRLDARQVRDVTTSLLAQSREQRSGLAVVHPGRVDVIAAGALILCTLMDELELPEVLISEADILDGIALSITQGRR